jgi:hypothetical protein
MAVGDIGGIGPGQLPVDVRAVLAQVALTNAKALAATLTPGEILLARVGADLGNGNVALTVRGQTLVANSATTLLPDSLIKLVVQSTDADQPVLRLLNAALPDVVSTSTATARAAALGLPPTALANVALQAFEQASAPLDPVRLKEALTQLQSLPAAQVPQRAQALASLAQAGLPATPPFIALAERSAAGTLPNPVAAVADLQRLVQSTAAAPSTNVPPSTSGSAFLPANGATAIDPHPAALSLRLIENNQSSAVVGQTVTPNPPPVVGASIISQLPVNSGQVVAALVQEAVTNALAPVLAEPAETTTPAMVPVATQPAAPASTVATTPIVVTPAAVTVAPPTVTPSAPPTPAVAIANPLPLVGGGQVPASAAPVTTNDAPRVPLPTSLVAMPMPDLGRGGATAVLQALALAGVRPRETGETVATKSAPTLLHRLDVPVEETDPIRASVDSTTRHPQQPQIDAAIAHIMREQAAETVVKPQALVDYDLVLGLPLQVNGQPMPARLAVAERKTTAGTATFLRVDAELTHLGPLSVRISGIDGGPMAITVLGTGPALGALTEALPDLNESLRALGLTAGVRVADLMEDLDHG